MVRLAEGRFEPRNVTLGSRSDDYVEVLSGVAAGEQVVTSANFLLDSESRMKPSDADGEVKEVKAASHTDPVCGMVIEPASASSA